MVLAEAGRSLKNLPKDLAAAIKVGRVPSTMMSRFLELEKSSVLQWLMQFSGFKERLLADDLFLTKVFMECGVGMFTKVSLSPSLTVFYNECVRVVFNFFFHTIVYICTL